ncbi:hypothetical protein G6F56_004343 [Rhizopus delemar]|nr:hypothetical protein G6F56_004343 [Rhizopus delemar]
MDSPKNAIEYSSADISTVATTRSCSPEPDVDRNALKGEIEELNTRLKDFEVAFATMEAKLDLLTAQQEAPVPTSDKHIGNNPEMSDHIRFAYMSLKLKWNFLVPYQNESNRAVRDELVLYVLDIPTHYNAPLYSIKKRVYNHYRNNRAAALRNVDLSRAIQLASRARARSRKTTKFNARKKAYWKNLDQFSGYPGGEMFLAREYQSEEEEDEEGDCFVRRSFTYRRGGLVRFFNLVDSFRVRSRSNPSGERKVVPLECELSPSKMATFPPWALQE